MEDLIMAQDLVIVETDGAVATVTLNRAEAMNAMSRSMRQQLAAAMRKLESDSTVRVVILGSDGLGAANAESADENPVKAIEQLSKPCIGAINGVAITGGFEVALACDVLIASDKARFADTHARVGIMPGWGLSQKLSRLIGPYRARELSLTGNFLDAKTAADWGLVNRVVPAADLMATARALAADMATIEPGFAAQYKRLINDGYATTFAQGMALEAERSTAVNSKVSGDAVEAARTSVQARGRTQ
jgi:enoyl-CoA hydratase